MQNGDCIGKIIGMKNLTGDKFNPRLLSSTVSGREAPHQSVRTDKVL